MSARALALALAASTLAVSALSGCAGVAGPQTRANRSAYSDFLVGRFAHLRADPAEATDRYFAALTQSPSAPELREGAVGAALSAGDARRARTAARRAAGAGVDVPAARLVRAVDALIGRQASAVATETTALGGEGLEELAGRVLAIWAMADAGRTDEATAALDEIGVPAPFSGLLDYQRAMILDLAGRTEDALAAYDRARTSGIWLPAAAARHVDLLARAGRGAETRTLYRDATGRVRDPDVERAIERAVAGLGSARTPLTSARGGAISLYALGALLMDQSESPRAFPLLTLALMLDPDLETAHLTMADALRRQNNYSGARAALGRIAPTSPYAETARASAAWLLRAEGRTEEALAAARATAQSGGRLARTTAADLYRATEHWPEAEAAYSALIASFPTPGPGEWSLFFSRGAVRAQTNRWAEAEADFRRALELSPDQPDVMNYLGYGLIDRGENLAEGLELVQRAVLLRPQSGHIVDSLGWAYFRLGQYETALEFLERAVELSPGDVTLNDHLGDALWRVGRRIEARYQWRRALSLSPSAEERARLELKVAQGLPADGPAATAAR